jgi:hypothetical protein
MGRAWKTLLEVPCLLGFAVELNYGVLCMLTVNGNFRRFSGDFAKLSIRDWHVTTPPSVLTPENPKIHLKPLA